jgi:hypothetical protein
MIVLQHADENRERTMRQSSLWAPIAALLIAFCGAYCARADGATETIVIMRHGEKPAGGYGQLTCQGLNRALALPRVLGRQFGKPDAIFAPDPARTVDDPAGRFDYVRPLATIEPTAVAFGLPVNADLGFNDVLDLAARLQQPVYRSALVFVAWEHVKGEGLARLILTQNGSDAGVVPRWTHSDYDSLYVVKLVRSGGGRKASFALMHEGLDGRPTTCP